MQLVPIAKLYIVVISLLALSILVYFVPPVVQALQSFDFVKVLLVFSALAFVSEIYETELVYKRMISTGIAVCIAAILLGGMPLAIAVTLIATFTSEIILRFGRLAKGFSDFLWRVFFNSGQFILSSFTAALVFDLLGGRPLLLDAFNAPDELDFFTQVIPTLGAFVIFAITNNALVSGIITFTQKVNFTYHMRFNLRYLFVQFLSLGILGILMAVVYAQSPWNLLLVLVPLGLVHVSLRNYMKLRHETTKTFHRISEMLNARDCYTYEHSQGVADLAEKIARKLGLDQEKIEQIKSAAMIHDIGKVAVSDQILQKPSSLTEEEWIAMKKHPDIGAELLKDLEMYRDVIDIVRHAHEHWDGTGYPKGLKGEEIPIGARIVAAADTYHALTTDRPYRRAYSHEDALKIMRGMSGVELDPQVVNVLLSVLEETQAQSSSPPKKTATA